MVSDQRLATQGDEVRADVGLSCASSPPAGMENENFFEMKQKQNLSNEDSSLPVTVYTPASPLADLRGLLTEMRLDLGRSGELSVALFTRNIKAQFRQSLLGYAWLFFPPLANTLVWFFLNRSGVVKIANTDIPYPAFVLVGTLLWQAFLDSLLKPVNSLTAAGPMLVKLNFPRMAPVIAGIFETTLISAVRLLLLIPVFLLCEIPPAWSILMFPLGYFSLVIMGSAIGALLTPLGLLYTDFNRAITVVGQFAMYATPVVYPVASAGVLSALNRYNPVTYLIETSRSMLAGPHINYPITSAMIFLASTALLFVASVVLHITLPRIIERMGM